MADISTLGQSLSLINRLKTQQTTLSTLSVQLATGKKTDSFAELGTDGLVTQRARADFNSIETYRTNIINTNRRIDQMELNITQFQEQTDNLLSFF